MFRPGSSLGPILVASRETTHIPSGNRPRPQSFRTGWLQAETVSGWVFSDFSSVQFSGRNVRGLRESDSYHSRWKRSRNWKLLLNTPPGSYRERRLFLRIQTLVSRCFALDQQSKKPRITRTGTEQEKSFLSSSVPIRVTRGLVSSDCNLVSAAVGRYATGSGLSPLFRTPNAYITQHGNAIISVLIGSAGVQMLITAT